MGGIGAGRGMERGNGSWTVLQAGCDEAEGARLVGWRSTRRWCGPISTPPVPATPRPKDIPAERLAVAELSAPGRAGRGGWIQ